MNLRPTSSSRLTLTEAFVLEPSWASQFYWARVMNRLDDVTPIVRGMERPSRPIALQITQGGRLGDFVWNTQNLVVASLKVVDLFERNGFTGYSLFSVEVRIDDEIVPDYHGIAVLGRAGPVDYERSRVQWFTRPDSSRSISAIDGLYFDPANWDGSDIFQVEDFLHLLMVKRVVDALKRERVSNFRAKPLKEFGFGPEGYPPHSWANDSA